MTITRTNDAPENQTARVDSTITQEVSWTLTFNRAVSGVVEGANSTQFAISIGNSATSLDSAPIGVTVAKLSDTEYTATVALPQSSYPTNTELNLTLANSENPLSAITQIGNNHDKGIILSTGTTRLTDAATVITGTSNFYMFNTGALTVANIDSRTDTSASNDDRIAIFTITFNARVSGVANSNFTLTQSDDTPLTGVTSPSFSIANSVGSGSSSRHSGETGNFSYTWTITTVAIANNETPKLTIANVTGINPEGSETSIDAPAGIDVGFRDHRFVATAPTVASVVRTGVIDTVGGPTNQRTWTVIFDQDTTNVNPDDFVVVDGTDAVINGASIISVTPETVLDTSGTTTEETDYVVTIQLPDTDTRNTIPVHLRIKDGNDIVGSEGATSLSDTALRRVPYGTAKTITDTNNAYSLKILRIMSVDLDIFRTSPTTDPNNALGGGTADAPASRPARTRWIVAYNIDPETGVSLDQTQRNALFNLVCSDNIDTAECDAIPITVALASGNTYEITIDDNLVNPTDTTLTTTTLFTTATTGAHLDGDTVTANAAQRLHYHRNVEVIFGTVARSATKLFYNFRFNELIENLADAEVKIGAGTIETPTTLNLVSRGTVSGGSAYRAEFDLTDAIRNNNIDIRLLIRDDATDRIHVASAPERIAYTFGADNGIYRADSPNNGFNTIPLAASAPTITNIERVTDETGATTAGEFINGDQDDDATADTYYWKVTFDQPISRGITNGATNVFQVVTANADGTSPSTDVITSTATIVDTALTDNETIVSFSPPATDIEDITYIHLVVDGGARSIFGESRLDPTNLDNNVAHHYEGTTGTIITNTTDNSNRYALRSRATLDSLTSTNSGTTDSGGITFQAVFSRPVTGLSSSNFNITFADVTGVTPPTVASTNFAVDGTDGNQWNIEVTLAGFTPSYTGSVTLNVITANLGSIMAMSADGNPAPISTNNAPDSVIHAYSATAPTITASNATIVGGATTTQGGDVQWDITFNQVTAGVATSHFAVNTGTIAGRIMGVEARVSNPTNPDDNLVESNIWRITADLDDTGIADTAIPATLTFTPNSDIKGARGPRDGSTVGRVDYVGTTPVIFDTTISHQTLQITSIELVSYATNTAIGGQELSDSDSSNATPDNTQARPTQAPSLLRYEVTYNIPPADPLTTLSYGISCSSVCAIAAVNANGSTHTIDITGIPNEIATITLEHGMDTLGGISRTTDVDITQHDNRNFYSRPRVTFDTDTVRDSNHGVILLSFSDTITNLEPNDMTLTVGGTNIPVTTSNFTSPAGAIQGRNLSLDSIYRILMIL